MLQQNAYILLAIISALLSSVAAVYIWRRRKAAGALSLALLMASISVWSFGYAMELAGNERQIMRFWLRFEYIGIAFLPFWGIRFAFQYVGYNKLLNRWSMFLFSIIPVTTLLLNWTNEWHHLFYSAINLDISGGMRILVLTKGIWYWVHIAYVYASYVLMGLLILQLCWKRGKLYRIQAFTIVIAMLPPIIGNVLYLTNMSPFPNLDLSPFVFNITGVLIIWGLFGYQLFNVVPVARDMLVESMSDGVLVLNIADCIVDINPAAQRLMALDISSSIGRHVETLLPEYVDFFKCSGDGSGGGQKTIPGKHPLQYFDLRVIPLTDTGGGKQGRLIILRDISAEKQLEAKREELIIGLQDALTQIKTLSGLLPICASCKKIRDDHGYWHQVEVYIREHSEVDFSHSICPECSEKLYPEFYEKVKRK